MQRKKQEVNSINLGNDINEILNSFSTLKSAFEYIFKQKHKKLFFTPPSQRLIELTTDVYDLINLYQEFSHYTNDTNDFLCFFPKEKLRTLFKNSYHYELFLKHMRGHTASLYFRLDIEHVKSTTSSETFHTILYETMSISQELIISPLGKKYWEDFFSDRTNNHMTCLEKCNDASFEYLLDLLTPAFIQDLVKTSDNFLCIAKKKSVKNLKLLLSKLSPGAINTLISNPYSLIHHFPQSDALGFCLEAMSDNHLRTLINTYSIYFDLAYRFNNLKSTFVDSPESFRHLPDSIEIRLGKEHFKELIWNCAEEEPSYRCLEVLLINSNKDVEELANFAVAKFSANTNFQPELRLRKFLAFLSCLSTTEQRNSVKIFIDTFSKKIELKSVITNHDMFERVFNKLPFSYKNEFASLFAASLSMSEIADYDHPAIAIACSRQSFFKGAAALGIVLFRQVTGNTTKPTAAATLNSFNPKLD